MNKNLIHVVVGTACR